MTLDLIVAALAMPSVTTVYTFNTTQSNNHSIDIFNIANLNSPLLAAITNAKIYMRSTDNPYLKMLLQAC